MTDKCRSGIGPRDQQADRQSFLDKLHQVAQGIIDECKEQEEGINIPKESLTQALINNEINRLYIDLIAYDVDDGAPYSPVSKLVLDKWLVEDGQKNHPKFILILGKAGTGKTSLCLKMAYELTFRFVENGKNGRFPLFLSFRKIREYGNSIQEYMFKEIERYCYPDIPNKDVVKNCFDKFLLLLDGLDEYKPGAHYEEVLSKKIVPDINEILRLGSKVLLTCRSEYVRNEKEFLCLAKEKFLPPDVKALCINEFNKKQIKEYLEKAFPKKQETELMLEFFNEHKQIKELAKRPMYLSMLSELLPSLPEYRLFDPQKPPEKITDEASLYNCYSLFWLSHAADEGGLPSREIDYVIESIAISIWKQGHNEAKFSDKTSLLSEALDDEEFRSKEEKYRYSLRKCPFLRETHDGKYSFHQTYIDFY